MILIDFTYFEERHNESHVEGGDVVIVDGGYVNDVVVVDDGGDYSF